MIARVLLRTLRRYPSTTNINTNIKTQIYSLLHHQTSSFCDSPAQPPEDELSTYEKYLAKYNQSSIRKPHEKMRGEEERIVQKYLEEQRYPQIINFVKNNSNNILADVRTASKIDEELAKNWQLLTPEQQLTAAYSLVKLRETKTFDVFKKPIEKKLKKEGIQSIQCEKLLIYICGELINRKSLRFLGKLGPKAPDRKEIYQKIYKHIDKQNYKGAYSKQKRSLLQYMGLMLDPTLNKREDSMPDRERSLLEANIESFLSVLGWEFERQVRINEYYVDYLVKIWKDGKMKEFILEVNGNHHYTITEKMKGREVLRNLIVNQYAPLRILHNRDFLISKGHRNKLAYIQSLFEEKMINWEEKKEGKNSRWEVRLDEELIDSARAQ